MNLHPKVGALSLLGLSLLHIGGIAGAEAAAPLRYDLSGRIDPSAGEVWASVRIQVAVDADEDSVRLWVYPDRLSVAPSALREQSWRWIYPGERSLGSFELRALAVNGERVLPRWERHESGAARGRDTAGADLIVGIEAGPARVVEVGLSFRLRVPDRFGRLGRAGGLLSLQAPWYPVVVGDNDAWEFDVPQRARLSLTEGAAIAGGRRVRPGRALEFRGPYLPVTASSELYQADLRIRGVQLALVTPSRMYQAPSPERPSLEGVVDITQIDVRGLIAEVAEEVFASAEGFGVELPPVVRMVQIPSRSELAATAPQAVLFSDRLFQIFPIDETLDFHRRALRRALFRHLFRVRDHVDPVADRGWAGDLRAVAMVDLDEVRRHRSRRTPQELLGALAFHPVVDQLLYAPQIAFEDAYFAAIEERDEFRDDPLRARWPVSRGRRILESARDAMTERQFRRFVAMLVNGRRSARAALARAAPDREGRLRAWLGASSRDVNYRLGEYGSHELPNGRYQHEVTVLRQGSRSAEPVEVLIEDRQGARMVLTWDGPGEERTLVAESEAPIQSITIDPRHRLVQSADLADGHPRRDDATDHPWRPPLLNGLLLNIFVTEEDFTGLLDFALRQRYVLEDSFGFRLERTRAATGGTLSYTRGLGPKINTNRRMGLFRVGVEFDRLHAGFADGGLGGWRPQLTLLGSINTVQFTRDPREGFWGSASLVGGVTFRDDSTVGGNVRGGIRAGVVLPLGYLNALALIAGGGFTAGDALRSELSGLGGGNLLRGFESGEILGRGVVYAVAEHRFTALRDLAMNLVHVAWIREIQIALFAGAGLAFDTVDQQDVLFAADVGAGLRFHFEYGGVQPALLSIDVGYPLTRTDDRVFVDGELVRRRNPIGFYVGFDQYF